MSDKTIIEYWDREFKRHSGDYETEEEYSLFCAFKAGWLAAKRHTSKIYKKK